MIKQFKALGVSAPVVRALAARAIHAPFAIQQHVLPDALAGLDILAQSPTGSGKTLAFGIPLVERTEGASGKPAALVLVPTRELALQVADDLRPIAEAKRLRVATVYGGASVGSQARAARAANIVIATPGRMNDLLERRMLDLSRVRVLVLDEADRMLDMGFKPQVDRILQTVPRNRQTMLFSATLEGAVGELAGSYTSNASEFSATAPPEREQGTVEHTFVAVTNDSKLDVLIEQLNAGKRRTLVFVRTKHGADRLVQKLSRAEIRATAMHGNLSQNQRERALARFTSGNVRTLVATDVAARGLDLSDITHVINYDPPEDDKGYVHRVGRTGRAGRGGRGITFVLPEQQADVGRVAGRLGHGEQFAREGMLPGRAKLVYSGRRGRRSRW